MKRWKYDFYLPAHAAIIRALFKDAVGFAAVASVSCRLGA